MQKRPQSHDGSTRFTEDNSTYPAGKCLPLHNLNFFVTLGVVKDKFLKTFLIFRISMCPIPACPVLMDYGVR